MIMGSEVWARKMYHTNMRLCVPTAGLNMVVVKKGKQDSANQDGARPLVP